MVFCIKKIYFNPEKVDTELLKNYVSVFICNRPIIRNIFKFIFKLLFPILSESPWVHSFQLNKMISVYWFLATKLYKTIFDPKRRYWKGAPGTALHREFNQNINKYLHHSSKISLGMRPPLLQLNRWKRLNFCLKQAGQVFNGRNKFIVSGPMPAVGGISLDVKQWTLLVSCFRTGGRHAVTVTGSINNGLAPDQCSHQILQSHWTVNNPMRCFRGDGRLVYKLQIPKNKTDCYVHKARPEARRMFLREGNYWIVINFKLLKVGHR